MRQAVHPHGCGENAKGEWALTVDQGPSPRVWGKRVVGRELLQPCRSIPTGVGKTFGTASGKRGTAVHPHGCGENSNTSQSPSAQAGPSPRVWGKHMEAYGEATTFRSIPTGVGKTRRKVIRALCHAVHPHGCGENTPRIAKSLKPKGPSPRVWGKQVGHDQAVAAVRSIPTGVGKTNGTNE